MSSRSSSRVGVPVVEGYRVTRSLRDSGPTRSFEALREHDRAPVVIKLHALPQAHRVDLRVEHDFRVLRDLEIDGIVTALALEHSGPHLALISAWSKGSSLSEHLAGRPISVPDFINVAVQITRALVELHSCKVIHRNIKPSNIFISPQTKRAELRDLGISVLLERERHQITDPWIIRNSLPYVSPEQTGRTHHEVDFRSDLYSLGISFYELLTGRRPFEADNALELIHAHLARRPKAPQWIRPELPTILSAITMTLIEKAPERRYQSAHGLLSDLERVAQALESGAPLESFKLALNDVPTVLQLPHRLYGRSREVERLTQLYRGVNRGRAHLTLVTGSRGIGKTALVNQLAEPVISRRGYFARGTCERDQIDKPYAGVFAAIAQLADQLLTQSDAELSAWRLRLRDRLGPSAAVMAELVPTLRPVLGTVSPAADVGPLESRNRLAVACAGLVTEFARPEHPLLLSLDDIQWADAATCELLATLLVEPGAALLLVGTLREDEVVDDTPFAQLRSTLDKLDHGQHSVITLGPLSNDGVKALIADSLAWPTEHVSSLAEIIGRNTDHNPLFVGQYLSHLFDVGLLRPSENGWEWDTEAIKAAGIPADLAAMMTTKLELLRPVQRQLLSAAAVIGRQFEVATLSAIVPAQIVDAALVPLIREGLLTTLPGGRCSFTHDQIREAAYRMNSVERRVELHHLVGESWLERSSLGDMDESFWRLVDHLDLGCGLFPIDNEDPQVSRARAQEMLAAMEPERRSMLAEFNALAGRNALISAAPRAAIRYYEAGIDLITGTAEDNLHVGHELRFALELGRCQALGLAGERVAAERYFERLLQAPLDFPRVARAVTGRIETRVANDDRPGAIACGLEALVRLGIEPTTGEGPDSDELPIEQLVALLRSQQLREIGQMRTLKNPQLEATLEILTALIPVSHLIDAELHVAFVTQHITIMLEHGRFHSAPIALAYAAMHVGTAVGQRQLALETAELAREQSDRHHHIEAPYWVVASWLRPYAEGLAPLRESVELALGTGDLEIASYATDMLVSLSFSAGEPLPALARSADEACRRLRQWQAGPLLARTEAYLEFGQQLLSGDESSLELGAVELEGLGHRGSQYVIRMLRGVARCLFGHWPEALAEFDGMANFQRLVYGAWQMCDHTLFQGLSAAACARDPDRPAHERERLLWTTRLSLELLESSAMLAAVNCSPRAALLEAELHAAEGRSLEAMKAYAKAHRAAAASGLPWLEALTYERAAENLRGLGLDELAAGALLDARDRYAAWGAQTKVAQLERLHPELHADTLAPAEARPRGLVATPSDDQSMSRSQALDFASILKASQAITADIQLDEVVDRVMAIALENAGAERGALLLAGDSGLELMAICDAESNTSAPLEQPLALATAGALVPMSLLRWVERTRESAVLDDAFSDTRFANDPYILGEGVRSALCVPIVKHDHLVGVLYLENKLSPGSFSRERLEVLDLLMAQAANALENAKLFEALRGSEVRWRSLVEGLPDVIMLVDQRGEVEFVNHLEAEANEERGGKDRIASIRLDTLVHPEDADRLHEQFSRAVRELSQTEVELRATLHGVAMRWYSLRLAPVAVDGRVARVIAVGTDITERREAAQAKQRVETQVRQQQRLESIGTLASGVAHEINNPIQGIMNYAELIGTMDGVGELTQEFCEEISHEAHRVAAIVRGLRSFARTEGDSATAPSDITTIVQNTLLLVRTIMGKDQIRLHVDLPPGEIICDCREQQIRQVVMNLITNARDALCKRYPKYDENKRIEIEIGTFTKSGHDLEGDHENDWVRISVRDHGGGVEPEVVARIFDPFFTTKGRDKGTGLGLSVSHGIVIEHGGDLRLENTPGVGACFHLELPLG